ncbi:hypothetical protein, partial [Stutzerimonas kunmingensis]
VSSDLFFSGPPSPSPERCANQKPDIASSRTIIYSPRLSMIAERTHNEEPGDCANDRCGDLAFLPEA